MADKPVNSVTSTSMIVWVFILLAVIVFVGFSQGTSPFQSTKNQTPANNFKQQGKLNKTLNDSWSLVYQDKNKKEIRVGLSFDNKSQCGTKDILKSCDPNLYKVGDQVTIEGSQENQTVMVVKLIK
jgi:hypothetical protein